MGGANASHTATVLPATADLSVQYPDAVLGQLDPHPEFLTQLPPANIIDPATGLPILDGVGPDGGKPKRAFEFLPTHLPRKLDPVKVEVYFKKHLHLTYRDLWHRQPAETPYPTDTNRLNQQRKRKAREPYNSRCWSLMYQETRQPTRALIEHVETLTWDHMERNSGWILVEAGLMDPVNPERILPHDYFLKNGISHFPSKVVIAALEESERLNNLAEANGRRHWKELPTEMLPGEWRHEKKDRANNHRENHLDPDDAEEHVLQQTSRSKSQVSKSKFVYGLHLSIAFQGKKRQRDEDEAEGHLSKRAKPTSSVRPQDPPARSRPTRATQNAVIFDSDPEVS